MRTCAHVCVGGGVGKPTIEGGQIRQSQTIDCVRHGSVSRHESWGNVFSL